MREEILQGQSVEDIVRNSKFCSQEEALIAMIKGTNIFLSGPAGSGKSYVISKYKKYIEDNFPEKNIVVTSTTGISALTIGGETIHRFTGMGVSKLDLDERKSNYYNLARKMKIRKVDILIIDEISMLSEWGLKYVYDVFKRFKGPGLSRMQIIVSGDFTQLPPVAKSQDDLRHHNFCYGTEAWQAFGFIDLYLDRIYRTEDEKLKNVLEKISLGEGNPDLLSGAKIIDEERLEKISYPILVSKNNDVDRINEYKQRKNPSTKSCRIELEFPEPWNTKASRQFARECKMDKEIFLKENDTVMVTMNESNEADFVDRRENNSPTLKNGMIGRIKEIDGSKITFIYQDPVTGNTFKYIISSKVTFKKMKIDIINGKRVENVSAAFSQIPLKLAYAISIHKSQGQTYSHIVCNLSNCWTKNLGYVALSRAKSFSGLRLIKPMNPSRPIIGKLALLVSTRSLEIKERILKNSYLGTEKERIKYIEEFLREKESERKWKRQQPFLY